MWNAKDVYYVSDSAAILAEEMGRALLCQFPMVSFHEEQIPFVRTRKDAEQGVALIQEQSGGRLPLVFCTIMDPQLRAFFDRVEFVFIDLYGDLLTRLEQELETEALREPGYFRRGDDDALARKVEAIHYTLDHDDGTRTKEYGEADIVLLGVSRSGKTPVSVYLATHMGYKTANFPLTSEILEGYRLPPDLARHQDRSVGLTTSPQLLHKIREQRYPGSNYASLATCARELAQARQIYQRHRIPTVPTDGRSIEEIAVQVTQVLGLAKKRRSRRRSRHGA